MSESRRAFLTTQPSFLNLGSNYVGARIRGSFQVLGATACTGYHSPE
jgi:hypothetical protein